MSLYASLKKVLCFVLSQYVHYEVESVTSNNELALMKKEATLAKQASEASHGDSSIRMFPPQVRQQDQESRSWVILNSFHVIPVNIQM